MKQISTPTSLHSIIWLKSIFVSSSRSEKVREWIFVTYLNMVSSSIILGINVVWSFKWNFKVYGGLDNIKFMGFLSENRYFLGFSYFGLSEIQFYILVIVSFGNFETIKNSEKKLQLYKIEDYKRDNVHFLPNNMKS